MDERQRLPEGLADLPPGPRLSAALASIDRTKLFGEDLCELLAVRARQVAHEQAQLLADIHECAHTPAHGQTLTRETKPVEFAADQVAFELRWSRTNAESHLHLASDLMVRLPMVYQALAVGRIDLGRAWAFSSALLLLSDEQARQIAERLIDKAAGWTAAQLRERLRYHALRADPTLARKRYEHSVADRSAYLQPYTDGTASLGGTNLPPDRAAAAHDRVDRLARAAKADGDSRTLAQLRADAMLDLLIGRPFQLRPSLDPITAAADTAAREAGLTDDIDHPPAPPRPRPGTPRPSKPQPAAAANAGLANDLGMASEENRAGGAGRASGNGAGSGPEEANGEGDADGTAGEGTVTGPRGAAGSGAASDGDDEPPDEDPIPDELEPIGRAVLGDEPPEPRPEATAPATPGGISPLGSRPTDDPRRCVCGGIQPAARRGVVDIQIKLSTLMCLDDDPGLIPGWGPVIADIARQVAFDQEANPAWRYSITDETGKLLHHGHTRRRPNATERAFVKARDKTCRAPGCPRPARHCDDDHIQEYVKDDGPSHRGNLRTLCRRHHRLRHEAGYVMHQITVGSYLWQAPNNRLYTVLPDATLLLTAEGLEPGPPPGYVNQHIPDDDPGEEPWRPLDLRTVLATNG